MVERHRRRCDLLVAAALAVGGAAVVAHHAQHVLAVLLVAGEGSELLGHFGRGRVGHAGHDGGQRAADGAAGIEIIRDAGGHQQAADIGVAEAERAEFVGELGDLLRRELRHHHRDFENDGPQPNPVLVGFDVELAGLLVAEGEQVQRRQIAGGVVEEHVFRARIAGADLARGRAGVPVVDRGVILQARIGRSPGGVADLLPQSARIERVRDLAVLAVGKVPLAVGLNRLEEMVGDTHRIVRVLPRDGEIGLAIPIGVVGWEVDVLVALLGELDHALDEIIRHHRAARELDLALERGVLLRREAVIARPLAIHAGLENGFQVLLVDLGAGDQRRHLLLFEHLPVDIGLDIRVIDIDDHHLRRAARGTARLDRAGGAVADFQERHQAG